MKLRTLTTVILTLAIGGAAFAQGTGHGRGGGMGMGGGGGMGSGNGPRGNAMGGIPDFLVAPDGNVFLLRHLETDTQGQFDVVSIRPSGALGWSYKLPSLGMASVVLAGTNVVAIQVSGGMGQGSTTPAAIVSKLIGISVEAEADDAPGTGFSRQLTAAIWAPETLHY